MDDKKIDDPLEPTPSTTTTASAPPPEPPAAAGHQTAKYIPNVDCRLGEKLCIAGSPIEVPYSTEPRASWTPADEAARQRFKEAGIQPAPHGAHVSPRTPPR